MSLILSLLRRLIQRPAAQSLRTVEPLGLDALKAVAGGDADAVGLPRNTW